MKTYLVKRNDNWVIEGRTHAPHDAEFIANLPCCPVTKQPRPAYALNIYYKTEEGRVLKKGESTKDATLVAEYDPDKEKKYQERQALISKDEIRPDLRSCLPAFDVFILAYLEEKEGRPEKMSALVAKFIVDKRKIVKE